MRVESTRKDLRLIFKSYVGVLHRHDQQLTTARARTLKNYFRWFCECGRCNRIFSTIATPGPFAVGSCVVSRQNNQRLRRDTIRKGFAALDSDETLFRNGAGKLHTSEFTNGGDQLTQVDTGAVDRVFRAVS